MNELVAKVDLNLWNGPPEKCFQKIPMIEIEDVFDHLDLTEENQNSWGIKLKKSIIFVKIAAGKTIERR